MDQTFYVTFLRDDGSHGTWKVPECLFGAFQMFMDTMRALRADVQLFSPENSVCDVVAPRLLHTGVKKIAAIKILRQYYGWDILTAKNKTDSAPTILPTLPYPVAQQLQAAFVRDDCGEIELPNALERLAKAL